ncbi:MAG: Stealth CR1 domain-containing protein [Lachnospiraceae bacterium]|nr:Stealth CR1 domain-containing protein [Lachnospiraceae bacterium]
MMNGFGKEKDNEKIDIVLSWVDGNDPEWVLQKEIWKEKVSADHKANSNVRYESWDNLQYWFRAVEKNLPWFHKIFFLTCGHVPSFLNLDHPKLRVVRHEEYIPQQYLPTFKSRTIELNVHRIPDLSENFILFNDDFFPLKYIEESYYFKNNKVCDEAVEGHIVPADIGDITANAKYTQVNNMLVINRNFRKRDVQKKNFWKWFYPGYGKLLERNIVMHYWYDFAGFRDPHMASAMKKETLRKLWEKENAVLSKTCENRFRSPTDITQFLIRYWQLCEGDFHPRRTLGKSFVVDMKNYRSIAEDIAGQKYQMVSLNENCTAEEFETIKTEINGVLGSLFPNQSSFEK